VQSPLFWNMAFKTGLLGYVEVVDTPHRELAIVLSALFLVLLPLSVIGGRVMAREHSGAFPILMTHLALSFAALLFVRILKPASCSNDFRYILPCLTSFCAFLAYSTRTGSAAVNRTAAAVRAVFLVLCVLYTLIPFPA
jgi:hypothetical protein